MASDSTVHLRDFSDCNRAWQHSVKLQTETDQLGGFAECDRSIQAPPELCTEEDVCRTGLLQFTGVLLFPPPLLLARIVLSAVL